MVELAQNAELWITADGSSVCQHPDFSPDSTRHDEVDLCSLSRHFTAARSRRVAGNLRGKSDQGDLQAEAYAAFLRSFRRISTPVYADSYKRKAFISDPYAVIRVHGLASQ